MREHPDGAIVARPPASPARAGPKGATRARSVRWVVTGLAVASFAFEQSPANEALRTKVGLDVLERSGSALAVGLVTALLTFVIEIVPTGFITAGLALNPSLRERLSRRAGLVDGEERRAKASVADVGLALGVGAGLVVIKHHLTDAAPRPATDLRRGAMASLLVAVVSGLIGWLVAGGIRNADAVGLGTPAGWVVDWATDWRFWGGVVGAYYLAGWVKRRRTQRTRR